ncbi:uncharacterized protein LOC128717957 [Anopheles marshallii]|uniref:uncharacterized protein LOC128717957 n=1 Tax=Anopheles marshallii TaxID=1521116 RepID=UPI00237C0CEF|nr:uncharacterized protein LOC128717957 [Anopheles marshallii]
MSATLQRQILTEFILLYKSFPCLWDSTVKEYLDRDEKQRAYERLVQKYKEMDKNATRSTVAKKINVLRTCYRRELTKLNKSLHSSCGDKAYKPTLWYFDLLAFLDESKSREVESSCEGSGIVTATVHRPIKEILQHVEIEYIENESPFDSNDCGSVVEERVYSSCSMSSSATTEKRNFSSFDQQSYQQSNAARKRIRFSSNNEDSFDIFGKHIAYKLLSLNKQQYILAQKLINDVLFEGEMETLNRTCNITTCNDAPP